MPAFQALAYPLMDFPNRWPSYSERGAGYALDRPLVEWFISNVQPPSDRTGEERASPLPYFLPLSADDLSNLPPTLLMTAEFDPLRDEGIEYVRRLREAGVAVDHIHAHSQMHGFLLYGRVVPRAHELIDELGTWLAARRLPHRHGYDGSV